jgi:predicted ArsR family transcriptional regulator
MLCRERHTVLELADDLGLTDNAVRAQLERLERDGLVAKAGSRPGVRRPHVEYEVTPAARDLFPRAAETLLVQLVEVLTARLGGNVSGELLMEAGRRLLRQHLGKLRGRGPRQRLAEAMSRLNGAGLGIVVTEEPGRIVIRSCSCPIASLVAVHPEMCARFAAVLGEFLGTEASEACEKGESARCCFEVTRTS